jgi:B12-binding domain/radical SAM domain protein
MGRPAFVVYHARSGIAALNVVSAALDADRRTAGTDVVFARTREEVARAIALCSAPAPVVGWSFYSPDFERVRGDLAWIKANAPRALHLAGGVHATAEPLATLRGGFDLVAIGEGESTICEIFAHGGAYRGCGTAYLDGSGGLVSHGPGERRPLDDFPAFNARFGKWNAIEITRGCVFGCSFCQTPFMFKARFRHRSVANVRTQLAQMVAQGGGKFVRFVTPTCLSYGSPDESVRLDAVEELLAAVRDVLGPAGKIYFGTFPSEVRPEHVTPEALRVLKRYVDNTTLVIGGQSGSERVLKETRRGHGVLEIERAVRVAVEAGFRPDVDFLLGLPGEARRDRDLSIALAERLVALGARIHSHAFMPLPGTPLRDARPSTIEPEIARAMEHLESRGVMYGQWKRQLVTAEGLLRQRRSHGSGRSEA